jgi:hypothetical protein
MKKFGHSWGTAEDQGLGMQPSGRTHTDYAQGSEFNPHFTPKKKETGPTSLFSSFLAI